MGLFFNLAKDQIQISQLVQVAILDRVYLETSRFFFPSRGFELNAPSPPKSPI